MMSSTHTGFIPTGPSGAVVTEHDPAWAKIIWVRRVLRVVRRWQERRQTFRALDQLDDHMLKDIGLTRSTMLAVIDGQERLMQRGWF